jgi:DNA (cytosine-5)-methyltransferase 1
MDGAIVHVSAPPPPEGELPPPTAAGGKPAYRVPSMREVEALPWNGLKVVSTFSGCGGSCLGFRMAGYRVLWSSEFVESARETYRANHPSAVLDDRDIREVQPEDILRATGLAVGELDVFEGSPPCASFSTAGKREKLWGKAKEYSDGKKQRTDDLFAEYLRLLAGLRPRAFVAENVAGMVIGTAKGHFLEALAAMRALGYRVGARLLDAQWLGVPQARRRVIFVGVREDLGAEPPFPRPLPYRYSLRDALPWLGGGAGRVVHDTSGLWGSGDVTDRPAPTVTVGVNAVNANHFKVYAPESPVQFTGGFSKGRPVGLDDPAPTVMAHGIGGSGDTQCLLRVPLPDGSGERDRDDTRYRPRRPLEPTAEELAEADFSRYAIGREWEKLQPGEGSDKYLNLARAHPDRPSPTVTAQAGNVGAAGVAHPSEPRKFTIGELRRVCGFPDDFVLRGTYAQQWERLGRAVPPPLMAAVARELAAVLLTAGAR